jgi:hypothetical protein
MAIWDINSSGTWEIQILLEKLLQDDYQSSDISEPWKGHTAVAWSAVHNGFPDLLHADLEFSVD